MRYIGNTPWVHAKSMLELIWLYKMVIITIIILFMFLKIRNLFRVIFIAFFVLIFLFVFYKHTNPLGRLRVYNYSFSSKINFFISPLRPSARLSERYKDENGDWMKDIKGPLVYFDLGPVVSDQKLTLKIKYKSEVPEIRFGEVLSSGDNLEYRTIPFYNEFLQNLSWPAIAEGGIVLYQKEKRFDSVKAYLSNIPQDKVSANYLFSDPRMTNVASLSRFQNPEKEVDYIITTYHKAVPTPDGWLETTFQFNLADAYQRGNLVTYLFSIPAFENSASASQAVAPRVTITNIQVVIAEPASRYWVSFKNLLRGNNSVQE